MLGRLRKGRQNVFKYYDNFFFLLTFKLNLGKKVNTLYLFSYYERQVRPDL